MQVVTPSQMGEIDARTINEYGIPGIVLMENAALKVLDEIEKMLGSVSYKRILVFAGKGNNGGDAFAVARHLFNKGAAVNVYIIANRNSIKGDAAINLAILDKIGLEPVEIKEFDDTKERNDSKAEQIKHLENQLASADLIIDGIFGTGLKGEVTGIAAEIINMINSSGKTVISIDIPSGIDGTTGEVCGTCIKAHKTVTFGLPKIGLILYPGCEYTGELVVADISIPPKVIDSMDIKTNIIDERMVSLWIPKRAKQTNKGDYGRVLIISGSKGMTGAGCLAARAAHRAGAGLVYLAVPESLSTIYGASLTETITIPLKDEGKGYILSDNIEFLEKQMESKDVIAIGPGLSMNEDTIKLVRWIVENSTVSLVLDADALNITARDVSILKRLKTTAVITPHPGEMARLTGKSIEQVQRDRINTAKEFACKWEVITVLKGFRTVIALPDGTTYINLTGNPGMATAGTGDVLTGVIAGLMAQGIEPGFAAPAGVYIHGLAGDMASLKIGEYSLTASDLVEEIPYAIMSPYVIMKKI
ncbi:MAG: NAD(P)H-hydrate dehydratase [Firmicutes bacterium]|nr:NAD(P)H-hydrate dehydratase [Bacillota bacterium]